MKTFFSGLGLIFVALSAQAGKLTILKAGPVGETATLAEANEVRVVFSEPMVAAGKAPKDAPWFHLSPRREGSFRWSGSTTLIFTPAPRFPFATKYEVTIDAAATALSGSKLDRLYSFSFTTPTIKLVRTEWYRRGGKSDGSVVLGLWFNQPVEGETIAQHVQLRTRKHDWNPPVLPPAGLARLQKVEPQALRAFDAKAAGALQAAQSEGAPVLSFLTTDWDRKKWEPKPELVVLETKPNVAAGTTIQLLLDGDLARAPTNASSGKVQDYSVELAPSFFVEKIFCTEACDPDVRDAIEFRSQSGVAFDKLSEAVTITDTTEPGHEVVLKAVQKEREYDSNATEYSLDELGYSVLPAHDYAIRIDPSLTAADGQKLGYTWMAVVHFSHQSAFISFGGGHGVWEASGGPLLPFHARNVKNVQQWLAPLKIDQLMPAMLALEKSEYTSTPAAPPVERKLAPVADKIQSYGVDLEPLIGAENKGLIWAAIHQGDSIPDSKPAYEENKTRATLVQVTNLGISVKDSPLNTVVFVTRLDDAAPVAGARVSIRTASNSIFWSGTTDASGIVNVPATDLRIDRAKKKAEPKPGESAEETGEWEDNWTALDQLHFIVTAEKDGDVAYAASNWHEGVSPWEFGLNFDLSESTPLLRGTVFTDRGVYKPGEDVHLKAVLRSDTPRGVQLLAPGAKVRVLIRDSHDKEVEQHSITINEWSSGEWIFKVPAGGPLGTYQVMARVEGQKLQALGDFLVAAYRRPDFRVDVTLGARSPVAGASLDGNIVARYLFGAPMAARPVKWTYSRIPLSEVPAAVSKRWPEERYSFLARAETPLSWETISSKEQKLTSEGRRPVALTTPVDLGMPYSYRLEGEVTDVSRQKIAGRSAFRIDPAPWYIGVKTPPYFADAEKGLDTDVVLVALDGSPVAGVSVKVMLTRVQWNSVRQAEGSGRYNWESERKEIAADEWTVTSSAQPAALHIPLGSGGSYILTARASDAVGHSTTTKVDFYSVGGGYTAWERFDHNRLELVPEKKGYRPGDTARIMIKSPWEHATALLTTEREGVRTSKELTLTSTQQTVSVPITERDIPNVFVSVLLVKGRTKEGIEDESDPGKPSFRLGYVELDVEDASKRLAVSVKADREEFRPATKAKIDVSVTDVRGKGAPSEVTLWAVDYGVLSLTGYKTPDVLESIYLRKALQVANEDSRQRIISRRVLTPKGATSGGGGGRDAGPGMLRKDFRVLAFWVGSIATDANGHARTEITLPQSLTTYRIMAVAGDRQSRFGWGQNEVRINKPLLLTPAYPRFLAVGDEAFFGSVIHSQLKEGGKAVVTIRSLDSNVLALSGETVASIDVAAGGAAEVRFHGRAISTGNARVQMTVTMNGESDALEDVIPVRVLVSPETYGASGDVGGASKQEVLDLPKDVVPGFGGLHLDLASTAMVGLSEGAEYLVTYPYGCAEQRSSAAMALLLASDLGQAFKLPGIEPAKLHAVAQTTLDELPKFQCGDGGFSFWAGECWSASPYLTANILHVLQQGQKLGYAVDKTAAERGYKYLEQHLAEKRPANEGWLTAYTAWQAFAIKVLVEGGRNEDSHLTRLMAYADRMPLFGIAYLADALIAKGEKGARLDELHRRLSNAILPEGGSAHVEELNDPSLFWLWSSNVRSTAIVLGTLVRNGGDEELVKRMVRWLMSVRRAGRWGSTQENVWAMESLFSYYTKYESEVPDFTAVVTLSGNALASDAFRGRSAVAIGHDVPMTKLTPGSRTALAFSREGRGTLFYALRLKYARSVMQLEALDQGFGLLRRYSVENGSKGVAGKSFQAGDLIKVTLTIRNTKERRFVAISDPIPAGTEPVESWFATTASELSDQQRKQEQQGSGWMWWQRGGFDHVERHDDRVELFATRLGEGTREFSYMLRATTAGTFLTAPMHAEEMYEPEVFGRTATALVEVKP